MWRSPHIFLYLYVRLIESFRFESVPAAIIEVLPLSRSVLPPLSSPSASSQFCRHYRVLPLRVSSAAIAESFRLESVRPAITGAPDRAWAHQTSIRDALSRTHPCSLPCYWSIAKLLTTYSVVSHENTNARSTNIQPVFDRLCKTPAKWWTTTDADAPLSYSWIESSKL